MRHSIPRCMLLLSMSFPLSAGEQFFAGALGGIATLSADGRSVIGPGSAAISLYKPENGAALNLLGGRHLTDYVSIQANYVWNRNIITLTSAGGQAVYEQERNSAQHAAVGDVLVYFRNRESRVRPYLSAGLGIVHFRSEAVALRTIRGGPKPPPARFSSNDPALRVAVGIDIRIAARLAFRYSFSETMSANPVSAQLFPPGQRRLANFQNLFGLLTRF